MIQSKILIDKELCDYCGTCVAVCPADAIELKESEIKIDNETCTLCKYCVDICPLEVLMVLS